MKNNLKYIVAVLFITTIGFVSCEKTEYSFGNIKLLFSLFNIKLKSFIEFLFLSKFNVAYTVLLYKVIIYCISYIITYFFKYLCFYVFMFLCFYVFMFLCFYV